MQELSARYLDAILATDKAAAGRITDAALTAGLAPLEIYEAVFTPALYAVGERWAANQITVTAEHIATALTEAEMTRLLPHLLSPERTGRLALVASVAGEQHRVGARMVADCFEALGWDAHFTGADTAIDRLLSDVSGLRPDLVALSLTLSMNLSQLQRSVEVLAAVARDTPVVVGGQGLRGMDLGGLSVHPNLRVVADLRQLSALISQITPYPGTPLPASGPLAEPQTPPAWAPFLAEIAALPTVGLGVADAFEAAGPALIADVNSQLEARLDRDALVGTAGLETMRTNHTHHHRFMSGWLRQGTPSGLMGTLAWVIAAYTTHGFALTYWAHEIDAWLAAIDRRLTPAEAAALRPVYRWMLQAMPRIAELPA